MPRVTELGTLLAPPLRGMPFGARIAFDLESCGTGAAGWQLQNGLVVIFFLTCHVRFMLAGLTGE